jgi:hypothetical protein
MRLNLEFVYPVSVRSIIYINTLLVESYVVYRDL